MINIDLSIYTRLVIMWVIGSTALFSFVIFFISSPPTPSLCISRSNYWCGSSWSRSFVGLPSADPIESVPAGGTNRSTKSSFRRTGDIKSNQQQEKNMDCVVFKKEKLLPSDKCATPPAGRRRPSSIPVFLCAYYGFDFPNQAKK